MRHVRIWVATLFAVVLTAACADGPTAPQAGRINPIGPSYDQTVQGCVIDGYCVLPPISGGWCDPYEELDWSCDDDGGDCMTSQPGTGDPEYVGIAGCNAGPGTGPGGGGTPPPPSEPGDTCNTGDPVVDSPGVEAGFADLWAASNPDSVMEKRHERGGWIVPDGTGEYTIQPFTVLSSNACEILVDTSNRPANAVAFVHTHPYETGAPMKVCQGQMILGRMVYETYMNEPSDYDGEAARDVGLPGYIIDYDKVTKYVYDSTVNWKTRIVDQNARCGY